VPAQQRVEQIEVCAALREYQRRASRFEGCDDVTDDECVAIVVGRELVVGYLACGAVIAELLSV
jgi:hypothetical protein